MLKGLFAVLIGAFTLGAMAQAENEVPLCDTCMPPGTGGPRTPAPEPESSFYKQSNQHIFRTDTGPDLDFYQPCSGGDNQVQFDIEVTGIELSTIQSARLSMAVFDVDFDCGSSCGGVCERDTVTFNDFAVNAPVSYLTGANDQWSSVSFAIEPEWIIDGANRIVINIDTLGSSCWCVTCDYGELTITANATPEITDLKINPDNAMTLHDNVFEAIIEEAPGYSIEYVDWQIRDKKTGALEFTGRGNPFTRKPAAGKHGLKEVTSILSYRNTATGAIGTDQETKDYKLFFEKNAKVTPTGNEPNWFEYWKRDQAVPDMGPAIFDATTTSYGYATGGRIYLGSSAGGQHYSRAIVLATSFGNESFGGPNVKGVDCAAEVIAHENFHGWVMSQWTGTGAFVGKQDSDQGSCTGCDDDLPDEYETATSKTKTDDTDSYDLEHKKSSTYEKYGDNEYMAMRTGDAKRGIPEKDWANPGKQSTPSYKMASAKLSTKHISGEKSTEAKFATQFSDGGADSDSDGLFDALLFSADVQVPDEGTYGVGAVLRSSNGTMIDAITENLALTAGTTRLNFRFAGFLIHTKGFDGPYQVDLELTDGEEAIFSKLPNAYQTAPFKASEFEGAQGSFSGAHSSSTKDTNSDGVADLLVVSVEVNVSKAGEHTVTAHLHDADGEPIAAATAAPTLPAGVSQVALQFSGLDIAAKDAKAPWSVRRLTLSDSNGIIDFYEGNLAVTGFTAADFRAPSHLSSSFTDEGVDESSNDLFEFLQVNVPVVIATPGNYAVSGTLYTADGTRIGEDSWAGQLEAGNQIVRLRFAGPDISRRFKDGPYELRNISLISDLDGQVDVAPIPYHTNAYTADQFERPGVLLTGVFEDEGLDEDDNGEFEALVVRAQAVADTSGTYNVNARLLDLQGNEIVWAANSIQLTADTLQFVTLQFDGAAITDHGQTGPYLLRDVYIYDAFNASTADYLFEAHRTAPYNWPFDNLSPTANAGPDLEVTSTCHLEAAGTEVTLDGGSSTDPDKGELTYTWSGPFTGSPVTGTNPTVTLTDGCPGDYVITLVVNDGQFDSAPDAMTVKVLPAPPTASFTADPLNGDAPLMVNFTDTSTAGSLPITSWSWDFGDGSKSTEQNPSHTYTSGGVFTVTLSAKSVAGSATKRIADAVTVVGVTPTGCSCPESRAMAAGTLAKDVPGDLLVGTLLMLTLYFAVQFIPRGARRGRQQHF